MNHIEESKLESFTRAILGVRLKSILVFFLFFICLIYVSYPLILLLALIQQFTSRKKLFYVVNFRNNQYY